MVEEQKGENIPFWESTPLSKMSEKQWESLCDGCGLCCVEKLEDAETGVIYVTSVACEYLDLDSCRCRIYASRTQMNGSCVKLTPEAVALYRWLPETGAYRCIHENRPLPSWHPLLCGSPKAMKKAGVTASHRSVSGDSIHPDDLHRFIDYQV